MNSKILNYLYEIYMISMKLPTWKDEKELLDLIDNIAEELGLTEELIELIDIRNESMR